MKRRSILQIWRAIAIGLILFCCFVKPFIDWRFGQSLRDTLTEVAIYVFSFCTSGAAIDWAARKWERRDHGEI